MAAGPILIFFQIFEIGDKIFPYLYSCRKKLWYISEMPQNVEVFFYYQIIWNFQEKSGGGWHLANCFDGLHELLASKGLAQPNFKAKHMGNTCVFYIYSFWVSLEFGIIIVILEWLYCTLYDRWKFQQFYFFKSSFVFVNVL